MVSDYQANHTPFNWHHFIQYILHFFCTIKTTKRCAFLVDRILFKPFVLWITFTQNEILIRHSFPIAGVLASDEWINVTYLYIQRERYVHGVRNKLHNVIALRCFEREKLSKTVWNSYVGTGTLHAWHAINKNIVYLFWSVCFAFQKNAFSLNRWWYLK